MKLLVLLLSLSAFGLQACAQSSFLAPLKWKHRVILLFSRKSDQQQLQQQLQRVEAAREGYLERDLRVFVVFPEQVQEDGEVVAEAEVASRLYQAYAPAEGFTCVLIGKDGGEKLRSQQAVSDARLFGTIDAMPMRRREMREQDP